MNTKNYLMASLDELFEENQNYSVVSVEEYFAEVDREAIRRSHMAAKAMTGYLKSQRKLNNFASSKVSRLHA